jgi:hypothetical protein
VSTSPARTSPATPFAASVKGAVVSLGGAFMISRYAKAAAVEQGLDGVWTSYFAGRCGVLGAVDADVATAALVFYPPDVVRVGWEAAWASTDPARSAARYAQACHEWGRVKLDGLEGAGRLAELAGTVAAAADVAGLPLFAAWRASPVPADDEARAALALHVLREHRGGLHGVAVLAEQLTPLQAILAGPGGEANAAFFGWQGPYEDVSGLAAARAAAEVRTDLLADRAYAVLDDAEQGELATLLENAVAHVHGRATLEGR